MHTRHWPGGGRQASQKSRPFQPQTVSFGIFILQRPRNSRDSPPEGSGARAARQDDRKFVSAIDKLKRAPDPIAPSTTARDAVDRRQMRIAVYECDAAA